MLIFFSIFTFSSFFSAGDKIANFETGGLVARLVLSLVLIVGLIYLSLFVLKKSSFGLKRSQAGELIQVLERHYLSPKKGIFIVKIGPKTLVLGVTETQVNLLSELNPDLQTKSDLREKVDLEKEKTVSFFQMVKDKLRL